MVFAMLKRLGIPVEEASIAIQGYGKVGGFAAQLLHDSGCRVVAVSDVGGGLYREKGLDPEAINRYKRDSGTVVGFPGADALSNDELVEVECDVLVPAAIEGVITAKNADKVKASIIVEAANGPITFEGDKILNERGIFVVPDILANAGGVTVSYFEWVQDLQAYFWSEEMINARLREIMEAAFDEVFKLHESKELTMRQAAHWIGVGRVAEAHLTRGLFP
jgi:glutamate dehydrogenase (NAD(P)+)